MYLRRALTPIYIDVLFDASVSSSLRTLADARGSYAHKAAKFAIFVDRKKAQQPMSPETARDIVSDCLIVCRTIAAEALKQFPAVAEVETVAE